MKLAEQMRQLSESDKAFEKIKERSIDTIHRYAETGYRQAIITTPHNLSGDLIDYLEAEGFTVEREHSNRTDTVHITW